MFSRRTDLPLDSDILGRFLPWILAFMVFLAILAAAGMIVINRATAEWGANRTHTLTVQIPPADAESGRQPSDDPRVRETLRILRNSPTIERADLIAEAEVAALLEPWLGGGIGGSDLPLPLVIDVEAEGDSTIDVETLRQKLDGIDPGISIDDHRIWLDRLVRLAAAIRLLAAAILGLISLATMGTVIYTTRTGLAVHRQAIEVLHLIGAQDSYIARQFAGRALGLGLRGGLIGLCLAVPTLGLIGYLGSRLETGLLPAASFGVADWIILAVIPLATAFLAMLTARFTVLRSLARML